MDTFQDFLLKLSLHTSIIKHNSNQNIHRNMEQNFPIIAKKVWKTLRLAYFMLRKNISKPKLLADLSIAMKRAKIAAMHAHHAPAGRPIEREFSCDTTPTTTFRLPFHFNKRKRSPSPEPSDAELFATAMEIFSCEGENVEVVAASPALPGLGRTPRVRQLRITDSPFPVIEGEDLRVDEAAEKFIMKFYRDLKRQNTMPSPS